MSAHRWAMAAVYELADAEAVDAAGWAPAGAPDKVEGPGCLVCRQTYAQAATLPCPGRIHPDAQRPIEEAVAKLPRSERRNRQLEQRRARQRGVEPEMDIEALARSRRARIAGQMKRATEDGLRRASRRSEELRAVLPAEVELGDPDAVVLT